jgi:hypothetical protein
MSFISGGTQTEVFYSSKVTATQLNTFTAEDNLMKTLPPCIIPAGFFAQAPGEGKVLKVRAWGRLGTTGGPTFTWNIRLLTSTTWSAAGIGFATAALTAGSTQTLAPWVMDVDIFLRTLSIGAASTIGMLGEVRSPLGLATPFAGTIPTNNTAFTSATLDDSLTYYLFLSAACGTSNAANLIQVEHMKVYGEN